ncbi:MAG: hypothetical protein AAF745_08030 [Planctomycetota bacterium]
MSKLIFFSATLLWWVAPAATAQIYPGGPLKPLSEIASESRYARSLFPKALESPEYCDSDSLRSVATIHAIRFGDNQRGVAVGDHGSILFTRDGGRSWNDALPVTNATGKRVQCRLCDAVWLSPRRVVAVGGGIDAVTGISRGVVLTSLDAGESWKLSPEVNFPCFRSLSKSMSKSTGPRQRSSMSSGFATILASGDRDPISNAAQFESSDGGVHWQAVASERVADDLLSTPGGRSHPLALQSKPMTAESASRWAKATGKRFVVRTSCRLPDQTVLCGGDHGMILRSSDRGQTWRTVHGGDASCAVLVFALGSCNVPWSLIGREALEHRLRVHAVIATGHDPQSRYAVEQAAMHVGAVATDWCVADPAASLMLDSLRRWIDVDRPKVIAIDGDFAASIKSQLLQHAVARGVQRVVEFSPTQRGESRLHPRAMLPASGVLAGDFDADSRLISGVAGISIESAQVIDDTDGISVQSKYHAGSDRARGVMMADGVMIPASCRLPGRSSKVSRRRVQVVQARLKHDATLANWFHADNHPSAEQLAAEVDVLLDQTSRVDRFRLAWSIANGVSARKQATEIWRAIAKHFPNASATRLLLLHAKARRGSVEWSVHPADHDLAALGRDNADRSATASQSRARNRPSRSEIEQTAQLVPSGIGHQAIVSPFQTASGFAHDAVSMDDSAVIQASAIVTPNNLSPSKLSPNIADRPNELPIENQTEGDLDLAWQMHPVRLIVHDALRRAELARAELARAEVERTQINSTGPPTLSDHPSRTDSFSADSFSADSLSADLKPIAERRSGWGDLLADEARRSSVVTRAFRAAHPPRLDGKLDESIWQSPAAVTRNSDALKLRLAYDDKFLYLAIESDGRIFRDSSHNGPFGKRDANLVNADRVQIGLDVDRDLLTAMNLEFTTRGRTHDRLDGSDHWDPQWYVASRRDNERHQVITELAIERSSLGVSIQPGDRWFINAKLFRAGQPTRIAWMPQPESRLAVQF